MSGPPYPRAPTAGDNSIGRFEIGVSPIGSLPTFDVWDTILAQYANSPTLTALIGGWATNFDFTGDFDAFYDTMWNVQTAEGVGLDNWGRIVGVTRVLHVASAGRYLGFAEAGGLTVDPFGQSPFYAGVPLTNNYDLSDAAFRSLIYAKALSNICDGSIPAMNQILLTLFRGRGNCYVTDGADMTMTYTFEFQLTDVEAAIIEQAGVLPTPAGVTASFVQIVY